MAESDLLRRLIKGELTQEESDRLDHFGCGLSGSGGPCGPDCPFTGDGVTVPEVSEGGDLKPIDIPKLERALAGESEGYEYERGYTSCFDAHVWNIYLGMTVRMLGMDPESKEHDDLLDEMDLVWRRLPDEFREKDINELLTKIK